jgi:hypothetical protein
MTAILLQPSESAATLTAWCQDGTTWSTVPEILAANLPLSSTFSLGVSDDEVTVRIGNVEVLRSSAQSLGMKSGESRLGIRWIGGTVRLMH